MLALRPPRVPDLLWLEIPLDDRRARSLAISAGQAGRVELLTGAADPPTAVRCRVAGGATGTAVAGLTSTDTSEGTLSYIVPPGHFVLLRSVSEVGAPTYTLTTQSEEVLA